MKRSRNFNVYIFVERPLNTGRFFFLFLSFSACMSNSAFKEVKQSLVVF